MIFVMQSLLHQFDFTKWFRDDEHQNWDLEWREDIGLHVCASVVQKKSSCHELSFFKLIRIKLCHNYKIFHDYPLNTLPYSWQIQFIQT